MASGRFADLKRLWRRFAFFDRLAIVATPLLWVVWASYALRVDFALRSLLSFLVHFFLAAYLLFKLVVWVRRGLWKLRNRLIVAYVFIAVVPVLLLAFIAGLSVVLIYQQVSAQFLYTELNQRVELLRATAEELANFAIAQQPQVRPGKSADDGTGRVAIKFSKHLQELFPGIQVNVLDGREVLRRAGSKTTDRFAGMAQQGDSVWLAAVVPYSGGAKDNALTLSVPVTAEFLDTLVPDLGPVQVSVTRPAQPGDPPDAIRSFADVQFLLLRQINARDRTLVPAKSFFDISVIGTSRIDAISLAPGKSGANRNTFFVSLYSRPSLLNRRLFASPGAIGDVFVRGLVAIGILFLLLEVAALVIGVKLTRTITNSVAELYAATEKLREGDLTHRVRVQQQDQLGALGDSFNAMTSSISSLIEEQRQRQRLENELSIAREVQSQLFPRSLPQIPGLELAAICRAARMVSGDYYDFVPLGPEKLAIAVADISGKGISAALLMASLQAALRSQLLFDTQMGSYPADLVARLNQHLYFHTSDDRYATLFYAVFDPVSRTLHYTNAGHLPPFYVCGSTVKKLEEGGMVIGLFNDCTYEQGTVTLEPGGLLVAYSDGLTEPENVYGEQFGGRRLAEEIQRHQLLPASRIAELLLRAADEWAGSPEQSDDMTVIVAKLSAQ